MHTANLVVLHSTILCRLLACLLPLCSFSQFNATDFTRYSIQDGLSDDKITSLTQDRLGYLWIGTQHGLNRFDGLRFKQFYAESSAESLPSDEILRLRWIDSNQLAVVTRLGLNILNIETMQQFNLDIPAGGLKLREHVNSMRDVLTDAAGNYYVVSKTGFYHFNASRQLLFRYDDYKFEDLVTGGSAFGVFSGWLDRSHILLKGQRKMFVYDTKSKRLNVAGDSTPAFTTIGIMQKLKGVNVTIRQPWPGEFLLFLNYSDSLIYINEARKQIIYNRLPGNYLNAEVSWQSELFVLPDSSLYIGGKDAGFFNVYTDYTRHKAGIDTVKRFPSDECNSLFRDREGRHWVGANTGLFKQNINKRRLSVAFLPDSMLRIQPALSVSQISGNERYIYAATSLDEAICRFDRRDLSFKNAVLLKPARSWRKATYSIDKLNDSTIICGTGTGLFWYNTSTSHCRKINLPGWDTLRNGVVFVLFDKKHNCWITTNRTGGCYMIPANDQHAKWIAFEQPEAKMIQIIYRMLEDKNGKFWMGGTGLARFDPNTSRFDFFIDSFPFLRWKRNTVSALACDSEGNIWMGNTGNGLMLYNPSTGQFETWSKAQGLPDNSVIALQCTGNSIWIACRNGIAKIDIRTKKITNAVSAKELFPLSVKGNRFFFDSAGQVLYIGLSKGLARLQDSHEDPIGLPARLVVENITVGNDTVQWHPGQQIRTNWQNRRITVEVNAVNYTDPGEQHYAYRVLNMSDTGWIDIGEQRKIVIDNAASGTYPVEIKVFPTNNRWQPQVLRIVVSIHPPFWNTWWFWLTVAVVLSTIIFMLVKYRINELEEKIRVREQLSQDLHDEVGSTLSGIAMYSFLSKQQFKASQYTEMEKSLEVMEQTSAELTGRLSDIVWSISPGHDSLAELVEKLAEYANSLAAARNIAVIVQFDSVDLSNIKLSVEKRKNIYLLCKEAINNAVKYSGGSSLSLQVRRYDHLFEISVSDNGSGFDPVLVKKGNGLNNMQKRAGKIGGLLSLSTARNTGAQVVLQCKIT